MPTFSTSTTINASRQQVWAALADIGSIHVWNPGVKASHATSEQGSGLGATRHCDLGGRNFLDEQVVAFEAGEALTMRITKTNLPLRDVDIRFRLEPSGEATQVTVSPEYQVRFGPIGTVMDHLFIRRSYEKGMGALLRGLKHHVEAQTDPAIT